MNFYECFYKCINFISDFFISVLIQWVGSYTNYWFKNGSINVRTTICKELKGKNQSGAGSVEPVGSKKVLFEFLFFGLSGKTVWVLRRCHQFKLSAVILLNWWLIRFIKVASFSSVKFSTVHFSKLINFLFFVLTNRSIKLSLTSIYEVTDILTPSSFTLIAHSSSNAF